MDEYDQKLGELPATSRLRNRLRQPSMRGIAQILAVLFAGLPACRMIPAVAVESDERARKQCPRWPHP